ncbi:hypothetical protein CCHR01_07956 [Colletotrichum chrysophilum]|uniref:Uncharacterized protein n=1 Tax=Colletotrichum chrysophilum TaxID=1836956 RepID=A0AAD9EJ80_9PEZI|nr:hypothetical protein CCHR01_07956 [Colletotrichum chrysophilum]
MRSSRLPSPEHIVKSALLYCFATPQLGPTHCPFKRTRAWDPDAHASLEHDPQTITRLRTSFHSSASILRLHPIPSHPSLPQPIRVQPSSDLRCHPPSPSAYPYIPTVLHGTYAALIFLVECCDVAPIGFRSRPINHHRRPASLFYYWHLLLT